MKVYLCQHGECVPQEVDLNRSLTENAKINIKQMADWLQQREIIVNKIYHSGKLRAQQTAEILAKRLLLGNPIEQLKGLNPLDDVTIIAELINHSFSDYTMLVGHLPFMSKLVSYLLIQKTQYPTVYFTPGTIVCLDKAEDNFWRIEWELKPNFFV